MAYFDVPLRNYSLTRTAWFVSCWCLYTSSFTINGSTKRTFYRHRQSSARVAAPKRKRKRRCCTHAQSTVGRCVTTNDMRSGERAWNARPQQCADDGVTN